MTWSASMLFNHVAQTSSSWFFFLGNVNLVLTSRALARKEAFVSGAAGPNRLRRCTCATSAMAASIFREPTLRRLPLRQKTLPSLARAYTARKSARQRVISLCVISRRKKGFALTCSGAALNCGAVASNDADARGGLRKVVPEKSKRPRPHWFFQLLTDRDYKV